MKLSSVLAAMALLSSQALAVPMEAHMLPGLAKPLRPTRIPITPVAPEQYTSSINTKRDTSDWRLKMTESERKELVTKDAAFARFEHEMLEKYKPEYCPAYNYNECSKRSCVFYYGMSPDDALKKNCMTDAEQREYQKLDKEAIEYDVSLCKKYYHDPKQCA